ncbi:MAG: flagellar biosynthesis anti-sigma factor FlgM [Armatimonadetes bacterium]|nr:flagellar biosynthesis anti-sigma factor FlgM [Armatimonadota bacterium]
MRISDEQLKKVLDQTGISNQLQEIEVDLAQREQDRPLIRQVTKDVINMPDREELVAELKRRVEAGEYNPTGEEIADIMIRRNIADRMQ